MGSGSSKKAGKKEDAQAAVAIELGGGRDGKLSLEEARAMLEEVDRDGDGFIQQHELADMLTGWARAAAQLQTEVATKAGGAGGAGAAKAIPWTTLMKRPRLTRDDRISRIRTLFDAMDLDGDKNVIESEFVDDLLADGWSKEAAEGLFKDMDQSNTGVLTLAKFDSYVSIHTINLIRASFGASDDDGNRQLSKKEFKQFAAHNALGKRAAGMLWDNLDTNSNGRVNFKEFRDWAQKMLDGHAIDTLFEQ